MSAMPLKKRRRICLEMWRKRKSIGNNCNETVYMDHPEEISQNIQEVQAAEQLVPKITLRKKPKYKYYKGKRKSRFRKRKLFEAREIKIERESASRTLEESTYSEDERNYLDIGQTHIDWSDSQMDLETPEGVPMGQEPYNFSNGNLGFIITDVKSIKTEPVDNISTYVFDEFSPSRILPSSEANPSTSTSLSITKKIKAELKEPPTNFSSENGVPCSPNSSFENVSQIQSKSLFYNETVPSNILERENTAFGSLNLNPENMTQNSLENLPLEKRNISFISPKFISSKNPSESSNTCPYSGLKPFYERESPNTIKTEPDSMNPHNLQFKAHKAADILRKHSEKSPRQTQFSPPPNTSKTEPHSGYRTRSSCLASTSASTTNSQAMNQPQSHMNDTIDNFHKNFMNIITEGNYGACQIFSVVDTVFFWQTLPLKARSSWKNDDHFSVVLCTNATGDFKLNPMIVQPSQTASNIDCLTISRLPVFWRSNLNGVITEEFFVQYFVSYIIPKIKDYLRSMRLPERALVLIENKLCFPHYLNFLSEDIKLLFLPHSCSFLQPLDHSIIHLLKLRYLESLIRHLGVSISIQDVQNISELLSSISFKDAIFIFIEVWDSITQNTLTASWSKLWSKNVNQDGNLHFQNEIKEIIKLADSFPYIDFKYIDVACIFEYLDLQRDNKPSYDNVMRKSGKKIYNQSKASTVTKDFDSFTSESAQAIQKVMNLLSRDPDSLRSSVHLSQLRKVRDTYHGLSLHWSQMDPATKNFFIP